MDSRNSILIPAENESRTVPHPDIQEVLAKMGGKPSRARRFFSLLKAVLFRPERLLDMAYELDPTPRHGFGKPHHPQIYQALNANRDRYAAQLGEFLQYREPLLKIRRDHTADSPVPNPAWISRYLTALDAVCLYGFLARHNPRRYFEVGSGNSTMFARRSILDNGLKTQIISFDPHPREGIDAICDRVHRAPLERADLSEFKTLAPGDILFFDGSHYVFTNTDVVVLFLEILPNLPPGVLVHMHDIWLPDDYPPHWRGFWFGEQYLLAAYLLGGSRGMEVLLPNWFISNDPELREVLAPLWRDPLFTGVQTHGASFWMRTK